MLLVRACTLSQPTRCVVLRVRQRTCLTLPRVFGMSLVWSTDQASSTELALTLKLLGQQLDIASLFTTVRHAHAAAAAAAPATSWVPPVLVPRFTNANPRATNPIHLLADGCHAHWRVHVPTHCDGLLLWAPLHGHCRLGCHAMLAVV